MAVANLKKGGIDMKRIAILLCVFSLFLGGCNSSQAEPFTNEFFSSSLQKKNGEIVSVYDANKASLYDAVFNEDCLYELRPREFNSVLNSLEKKKGIVVVGQAFGQREGHYVPENLSDDIWQVEDGYTLTSFKVEEVLDGELEANEIVVVESYVMREIEGEVVRFVPSGETTILQNGELVLLYLAPSSSEKKNHYYPIYVEDIISVSKNTFNNREEYIRNLCGYYRKEEEYHQFKKRTSQVVTVSFENGLDEQENLVFGEDLSEKRIISNEDLLAELTAREDSVGMMVSSALKYDLPIYPKGHILNPIDTEHEIEMAKQRMIIGRQRINHERESGISAKTEELIK